MLTDNNQVLSKNDVLTKLRKHKANKFAVWDITSKNDHKQLLRHIEKLLRNESVSIIVLPGENK
jgi:hypothetical protein